MENEIIEVQPQAVAPVTVFNVEGLISEAIKQGTPVDTMERILAMRRELKEEWAKEEFTKSMAAFQAECPVIEKKKKVDFTSASGSRTNYNYAPLDEIVEQVKELLGKHGFSYTFDTQESDKAIKVFCYAKHIAGHTETSSLTIEIDSAAKMNRTQQYGSANTYGKRYAFCNAFGIMTGDEDNDAQPIQSTPQRIAAKPSNGPSRAQIELIGKLAKEKGYTKDDLYDNGFTKLTGGRNGTASELIEWLQKAPKKEHLEPALPIIQVGEDADTEEQKDILDQIKF